MAISSYYAPTEITFGKGAENEIGKAITKAGAKRVLIHYGSERVVKDGLVGKVEKALDECGIQYEILGGVVPNPRIELARKGVELVKGKKLDFILAIGGGSVIDSAKAIGYGSKYDGDVWDVYEGKFVPTEKTPVGVILTMSAAGSEMSDSSVLTNEALKRKRGYNSNLCRPTFALMDPELTYSLPPYQTAAATVDIMMHTMERYFTAGESLSLTDEFAFALLRTVKESGKKCLEDPCDYEARANLMWASSVSHNGFMALGNGSRGDWTSHQLEHELSGMFDVAHGAGLAAIWPSWARYVMADDYKRFAKLGYSVFGLKATGNDKADAEATVKAMEEFYHLIKMPINIHELGYDVTEKEIGELAESCSFFGKRKVGNFHPLDKKAMADVYRLAK